MKNKVLNRVLSLLLSVTMMVGMVPISSMKAYAIDDNVNEISEEIVQEIAQENKTTESLQENENPVTEENVSEQVNTEQVVEKVSNKVVTITASLEKDNYYVVLPQSIVVSEDLSDTYGYIDSVTGEVSALDSLIAIHQILFGDAFTPDTKDGILDVSETGFITAMMGEQTSNVGFAINGYMPNDGILSDAYQQYTGYSLNQAKVIDGDNVQFFFYNPAGNYGEIYTNFVKDDKHVTEFNMTTGVEETLSLQGYSFMYEGCNSTINWKTIKNAQICIVEFSGENLGALTPIDTVITDENGNFKLNFANAGKYYIAVTSNPDTATYIIPQICKVVVSEITSDQQAAISVDEKIDEIGEVTVEKETLIISARNAYNSLTQAQRQFVKKLDVLKSTEKTLEELNKKAALDVDEKISAIGNVTTSSRKDIETARKAYEQLTATQKKLVTKLDVLGEAEKTLEELSKNPNISEQPKEVSAYWPNFRGNQFNIGITNARTPQTEDAENIYTKWTKKLGSGWMDAPSAQIIVDNTLIVMCGRNIYKLDLNTGDVIAKNEMVQSPNWGYTPPTYGNGMIFCPIDRGTIQAFNAETLESLWVYTDPMGGQSLSSITYDDGYIYTGFWNSEESDANYVCINTFDEDITSETEEKTATWTYKNKGGFYWAGSVVVGDAVIFGMDNGEGQSTLDGKSKICSFNKKTGEIISELEIVGDQRSSIVFEKETNRIYFTTKAGYLYRADVNVQTGEISNLKHSSTFNRQATATPVVYKGRVYSAVGGGVGAAGEVVVADAETLKTLFTVPLKGYPQCSLLLSTAYEEQTGSIYLYSTYNIMPGGVSAIKVKTDCKTADDAELVEIYDAKGFENYCISSIICDEKGTLYYKNDSGYIFAIGVPETVNVEKIINDIGTVTTKSKGVISAARGAYEALSDADKQTVKNYNTLVKAEITYVEKLIEAIGKVTSKSQTPVENARAEYELLTTEQQEQVSNYTELVNAEKALKEIAKAELVDKKIQNIGEVTINSYEKLLEARKAYNELTVSEKTYVVKYDLLVKAEEVYGKIETNAVRKVENLINAIGKVTKESSDKINQARKAYDELPAYVKSKISNYNKLVEAENEFNTLNSIVLPTRPGTVPGQTIGKNKDKNKNKNKVVLEKTDLLKLQDKFEKVKEDTSYKDALDLLKTYNKLDDEQQLALSDLEGLKVAQNIVDKENHKDKETGISISGIEWNIKLVIEKISDDKVDKSFKDKLQDKDLLAMWDIKLVDVLTGEEVKLNKIVSVKIPATLVNNIEGYEEILVLHRHNNGEIELLSCEISNGEIVFNASEFSQYGIVGCKENKKDDAQPVEETQVNNKETPNNTLWIWWAVGVALCISILIVILVLKRKTSKEQ